MKDTDLKHPEIPLTASEQRYRLITDNIPDVFWTITPEIDQITYVSPAYEKIWGRSCESLYASPSSFLDTIHPDDRERAIKTFNEARDKKTQWAHIFRIIRPDGLIRWIEDRGFPLFDDQGNHFLTTGVAKDITGKIKAAEDLQKSEEKYRALVENVNSIVLKMDRIGNVTFINEFAQRFFGYDAQDILQKNVVGTIVPETESTGRDLRALIEDIGRNPDNYANNVNENMRQNGERVWIVWTNKPVYNDKHEAEEILCIGNDITERRRTADIIRASETWYRAIFENTGTATVIIDENTTIIHANAEYEKLSGYKKDELEGKKSWTETVLKEDLDRMLAFHKQRRIDETAGPTSYEFRFVDRQGNIKNILLTVDMIPNTTRSVASLLDMTDMKKAEEALRKSDELYATLMATLPDAVLFTDNNGKILFINEAGLKIGGYTREDLIENNIMFFIAAEDQQRAIRDMMLMYEQDMPPEDYHLILKDGRKLLFEINGNLLRDADGSPYGAVFVCRDLTERKRVEEARLRLEERLRRAEKMEVLGTLAGGVAHDLNNVLGVLTGYSELLLQMVPEGNPLRQYATNIVLYGQKGAAIIQDLLTLTRRGVAISEVVNLNTIISSYFKSPVFERLKEYHPYVTFNTNLEGDLLNIKGSPLHLEKTLMNLVSNAAEAISENGEIMVRTENRYLDTPVQGYDEVQEGDYVVLTISDNGQGLSSAEIERIFEPFFTKKTMGRSGTGLGLTVVWGTVKDHEGYIDVQSEEGKGTQFSLYFPVTRDELAGNQQVLSPQAYQGNGESILVVDDVQGQRELAEAMLNKLGYKVASVPSGEEAVSYISNGSVDILLLDMIMPHGIDGLETYKRVLAVNPKQKAILVSGFSETERVKEAQRIGAGSYVRKPYSMEKIGLAIRGELDRSIHT